MVRLKYVHLELFDIVTTQPRTTFGSPEPVSSVAGKEHYGLPALSGKVTGISNIRFRILVHCSENNHKCTFPAPRPLGKAPVKVCLLDSHLELSGKVVTLSHIGYEIQIVRLKIRQRPSFHAPRLR
ncbi:hypothetical protein TNCV_464411 [Trichonephila clavipes]|nr:hypothetical protein TNCV_464411 [Trichonephila clavipes]